MKKPKPLTCPMPGCGSTNCVVIGKRAAQAVCRACGTSNTRRRFERPAPVREAKPYYQTGKGQLWRPPARSEDPE